MSAEASAGGRRSFGRLRGPEASAYTFSLLVDDWELSRGLVDITVEGLAFFALPEDQHKVGDRLRVRVLHEGVQTDLWLEVRNRREQEGRQVVGGAFLEEE